MLTLQGCRLLHPSPARQSQEMCLKDTLLDLPTDMTADSPGTVAYVTHQGGASLALK